MTSNVEMNEIILDCSRKMYTINGARDPLKAARVIPMPIYNGYKHECVSICVLFSLDRVVCACVCDHQVIIIRHIKSINTNALQQKKKYIETCNGNKPTATDKTWTICLCMCRRADQQVCVCGLFGGSFTVGWV